MSDLTIAQSDIDKLNEKDRAELRQFFANEEQKTKIQSQTHALTELCWKKCVTSNIKNGALDKNEQSCLANCVDRFMDVNIATMRALAAMGGRQH
ncbi:Tim10/DDP family zinc finger-domain-containing protein [Cladorrhinum samala]|uniref:Mitochondrial import inner membrane translocase subunit n=1 Tax=Cladorrhinum samala TaxID=585594 RepID=A0AAV9HIY9_9PEZI|nr:Tim10/DDP family zinc finger-domain-containing protein [Cladorrhinum samala]